MNQDTTGSQEKNSYAQPVAGNDSHSKDDYAKTNLLQIPSIQSPKGGGALRSIDEKFQVNPANGTASFSIDFPFSKSRGLDPQLSLSYNSGNGNSAFGLGWDISLPSIRRRTDKLLPQYRDAEESDVFQLAGAEDLVPKLVQDNKGNWTEDVLTPGNYAVKRYRPRIESGFTLIEKITLGSAVYWKTTSKDNKVTFYGLSPQGRIADPADPTHIFEWLPEISYDDKGSCYQYFYVSEDNTNVPNLLHERNRLNGNQLFTNTYLKSIRYGNATPYSPNAEEVTPDPYSPVIPDGTGYLFEGVLDYGDHNADTPLPAPDRPWPSRLDAFSRFKPGFEIRTYRLCRRFLLFHLFKELDTAPVVIRSLDLTYQSFNFQPASDPYLLTFAEADFIGSLAMKGWTGNSTAGYLQSSYPPATFTYRLPVWNTDVQMISPENIPGVPEGLTKNYHFTDLWNEGIAGILHEASEGWYYNSNLGNGVFTPALQVASKPSFTGLDSGSLQLQTLTGDGRKFIVSTAPPNQGYFELTDEQEWLPFHAFDRYPRFDPTDPNIKFIDLNGDGRIDIVLSEEAIFTWYPSAGMAGYDSPARAPKPFDEEQGPAIVFADPVQSIFLADMSGDGLTDIVRIRNGEISYWPNMGYGRFGAKVNMTDAPVFDDPDRFNPVYLRLADINGTGATDVLYLGRDSCCAWLNLSGNAWGPVVKIDGFPATARPNEVAVADLLGIGTACITWSSPLTDNADAPLRYIDLMGGNKPYLLQGYANGMGKQVSLAYRSSTWFYLQDKQAGSPWITKLPFPVQCVTSSTIQDTVSGSRYSCSYSYHHGYYDHPEKEFRGFGRVEQTDTDDFDTNAAADQTPMLTRTWYHTGAYFGIDRILHQLAHEYFQNPAFAEYQLPEPALPDQQLPAGLTADEAREALRACKGMVLRQEIYALDATAQPALAPYPFSVAEHNNRIFLLQPQASNLYASYLSVESEAITYHYERNPADPRIAHTLNTAFDAYGNILESYAVSYPRQPIDLAHPGGMTLPGGQPLPTAVAMQQRSLLILYTKNEYTGALIPSTGNATYRLPVSCESIVYQLTDVTPSASYFSIADLSTAPGGMLTRLKQQRSLFLANDLVTPLPLYTMDTLGILYQQYHLAFDATVTALNGRADPAMLHAAHYILSDDYTASHYFPSTDPSGEWWVPSGTIQYLNGGTPLPFLLASQYLDAYGYATTLAYDPYWLLMQSVTDPLGNTTSIPAFDYRVLSPQTVLDPNSNATDFKYDRLGLVIATALRGKGEGDTFNAGFTNDLSDAQITGFFGDPVTNGPALLQGATTRYVYQFPSLPNPAIPFSAGTVTRRLHASQTPDPRVDTASAPYQYSFEYTDGLGRSAMKKVQADLYTGKLVTSTNCDGGNPPRHRWIGSGKTVFNNKGKAVMQYEPYFSPTPAYEEAPANGVSPVLQYDPEGRLIRTDFPDGSFSYSVFDAWVEIVYDQNDTVTDSNWYTQHSASSDPKDVDAATKAAAHYNTPTANHLDPLGRNFYTVAYNMVSGTPAFYPSQTMLDLNNNPLQVIDALGNTVMQYDYDLLNRALHRLSMDAGERWMLSDSMNKPFYQWDINGAETFVYQYQYDSLHRNLNSTVQVNGSSYIYAYNVYGEGISINGSADTANNLRGRLYRQFDDTGLLTSYLYDFKGNLVQSSRIFSAAYKSTAASSPVISWSGTPATDMNLLESDPSTHLLREYTSLAQYDAVNRPILQTRPFIPAAAAIGTIIPAPYNQTAVNNADVIFPGYGESGALNTVNVYYRGGTTATPVVTRICHNEKGQRHCLQYGNNSVTKYHYDPDTFRLIRIVTTRNSGADILQDLNYYFDPIGNITYVLDKAQPPIFYNNQRVLSDGNYTYDALYRLIIASGREQIAQNTVDESAGNTECRNYPFDAMNPLPAPSDPLAMRSYTQQYSYDAVGSLTQLQHVAGSGSYTRSFAYNNNNTDRTAFGIAAATPMNNQLLATTIGASPAIRYDYDGHGNMTDLPQLPATAWNFKDQLSAVTQQTAGGATGQTTYYAYDASGMRSRKVTETAAPAGGQPVRGSERLYIGNFEVYRVYDATGAAVLERETLHLMDDKTRIALVDNKTIDTNNADGSTLNTNYARYQYGNHLGSTTYELDSTAKTISYEEYHPFGTSSFQAADATLDVPARRYRYTGKERDEESGLEYHSARYYLPWLGRWLSADPTGLKGGNNLYAYCNGNPVKSIDPKGTDDQPPPAQAPPAKAPDPPAAPPDSDWSDDNEAFKAKAMKDISDFMLKDLHFDPNKKSDSPGLFRSDALHTNFLHIDLPVFDAIDHPIAFTPAEPSPEAWQHADPPDIPKTADPKPREDTPAWYHFRFELIALPKIMGLAGKAQPTWLRDDVALGAGVDFPNKHFGLAAGILAGDKSGLNIPYIDNNDPKGPYYSPFANRGAPTTLADSGTVYRLEPDPSIGVYGYYKPSGVPGEFRFSAGISPVLPIVGALPSYMPYNDFTLHAGGDLGPPVDLFLSALNYNHQIDAGFYIGARLQFVTNQ